jgi:uncharacterized protein (DUF2235 family)
MTRRLLLSLVLAMTYSALTEPSVAQTSVSASRSPRRLVLCLDGTWNSAYVEHKRRDGHTVLKPTNVLKMCRAVLPFDEGSGRAQISYYDIGVGSLAVYPGLSNRVLYASDRVLGGGWGAGFEGNVEDALHFLALNFQAGDEVFIFGFSRGAATARAVTQFLDWNRGLPQKDDAYYLPRLFRAYVISHGAAGVRDQEVAAINADRQKEGRSGLRPLREFHRVPVKFLGVWDTVMALGSRFDAVAGTTSVAGRSFYAGRTPAACVEFARQALAVDEHRFDFRPEVWSDHLPEQRMEQRWFAGVHSNIGGGYGHDGLANVAFRWMIEGAIAQGLKIDDDYVRFYVPFAGDSMYDSSSLVYRFLDFIRGRSNAGKRDLLVVPPNGNADIDRSVITRMQANPGDLSPGGDDQPVKAPYRPENVIRFLAGQPDLAAYLQKIGVPHAETIPLPDDVKKRIADLKARATPGAQAHLASEP